ncbi:MAG: hypothetical protein M0021_10930 [Clostridia bacterium]|nr:hypothetical protein [Clostridia bacterium]
MIVLLITAFLIIILIDVPRLVKGRMWRELAAFSVFLLIGMALAIPQTLGKKVPNPNTLIEAIFKPAVEWLK